MSRDEIPPGTLHLLILKTLSGADEMHGSEIAEAIERQSGDVLTIEEGSLYPALQRLLAKGWIEGEWSTTASNRRARYYRMTKAGRRRLETELSQFHRITGALVRVLQT
jgi:PadR family transcriptional regulator, regulatory protein PadR